ncbi:hypothetical protein OAH77_04540 [Flavobacteriaceae bacterium]|nr:hypothetical protein [Flavobacteriaceae bacterium]
MSDKITLESLGEQKRIDDTAKIEYQEQLSSLTKKHGAFYAFCQSQFDENKKEGVEYVRTDYGLICPKENMKAYIKESDELFDEMERAFLAANSKYSIISNELYDTEAFLSRNIAGVHATVQSYGITYEEVELVYNNEYPIFLKHNS